MEWSDVAPDVVVESSTIPVVAGEKVEVSVSRSLVLDSSELVVVGPTRSADVVEYSTCADVCGSEVVDRNSTPAVEDCTNAVEADFAPLTVVVVPTALFDGCC